jgi:hypothetical protein
MSMTYTWKMKEIKVMDETNSDGKVLKDAVVQTTWTKTGKDADGNEGVFSGATPLTAANVSEGDFKALNTLTEEQVLTWIKALVEPDAAYVAHINEQILKDIERSKVTQKAMPWGDPDFVPPA